MLHCCAFCIRFPLKKLMGDPSSQYVTLAKMEKHAITPVGWFLRVVLMSLEILSGEWVYLGGSILKGQSCAATLCILSKMQVGWLLCQRFFLRTSYVATAAFVRRPLRAPASGPLNNQSGPGTLTLAVLKDSEVLWVRCCHCHCWTKPFMPLCSFCLYCSAVLVLLTKIAVVGDYWGRQIEASDGRATDKIRPPLLQGKSARAFGRANSAPAFAFLLWDGGVGRGTCGPWALLAPAF